MGGNCKIPQIHTFLKPLHFTHYLHLFAFGTLFHHNFCSRPQSPDSRGPRGKSGSPGQAVTPYELSRNWNVFALQRQLFRVRYGWLVNVVRLAHPVRRCGGGVAAPCTQPLTRWHGGRYSNLNFPRRSGGGRRSEEGSAGKTSASG